MKELTMERKIQFQQLRTEINGSTPLLHVLSINGRRHIYAKDESYRGHPTQSHYDRVFLPLIEMHEKGLAKTPSGKEMEPIDQRTTHLVEVSTGNAGAAFAWAAKKLGYAATAIVPDGLPTGRLDAIKKNGAAIEIAERKNYMEGSIDRLKEFLKVMRFDEVGRRYITLNHPLHMETTWLMAEIVKEAFDQANSQGFTFNAIVLAIGNGSSLFGPATVFRNYEPKGNVFAWEPFSAGRAYDMLNPGAYRDDFGVDPGFADHNLIGAVGPGVTIPFVEMACQKPKLIDEVVLVSDEYQLKAYRTVAKRKIRNVSFQRAERQMVYWEETQRMLNHSGFDVGRTSAASVAVAMNRPYDYNKKLEDFNTLVIFYDDTSKYYR